MTTETSHNDLSETQSIERSSDQAASPELPTLDLLEQGCQQLGSPLSATQLGQFVDYYHELVAWNKKFNLTGITQLSEVQTKHFLDSLVGLPVLAEELHESIGALSARRCIDVGTGAGLPAIPLKIGENGLHWTLLDGTGKKITFLRHIVEKLALQGIAVVQGRAEELGRNHSYRAQFDIVTARAVAPLNTLVEYLLPLTALNGLVMIYKGAGAAQEFMDARKAIQLLGGETVRMAPVQVPFLDEQRFIVLIKRSGLRRTFILVVRD
ncbi:MAG: 16S rRNA (guanine(527)-N(7))-methyltransferase RsmG [Caldilineaceae bacterium]